MEEKVKKISPEIKILLLQFCAVAVIFISITVIKFLDLSLFEDIKKWYVENFCSNTSVSEVLQPDENSPEETPVNSQPIVEESSQEIKQSLPVVSLKLESKKELNSMCLPLVNYEISSRFGYRKNPITKKNELHKGLDLSANHGEPIYAAATGMVETVKNSSSYGKCIIINHGNGLKTLYAHCSAIYKSEGQSVIKGDKIAAVGNTGQSTRSHLHFEVISKGEYINPEWVMSW